MIQINTSEYSQHLQAIYENMLVELPFASFFLSKLLSRHSGDLDIHHLASLDPEMYKNLLFLKHYDGNIADLELDFTAVNNQFGDTKVSRGKFCNFKAF